jgi:(2R)-3-sulfolactate dehydrogenase (NADP+)
MAGNIMTLEQIEELTKAALMGAGASDANAASVAKSTWRAERDGVRSHGLMYVPIYAEHVQCGKVDGKAVPEVSRPKPAAIRVDAKSGFAHPAIDAGFEALVSSARENGVGVMTVFNSYNCGVLGHHAERIAEQGLLGLCFTNAPASIAPTGGSKPVIGTNPFALGVPGADGPRFVIDQSASAIAKSEIMLRNREGEPIEPGWALDADGNSTTDAAAALKGSMVPSGGAKGFGAGLMVEIFAAALSGAVLGKDASPFSGTVGGPPNTGQCFIALDPDCFSGGAFNAQIDNLVGALTEQAGTRLPGSRRSGARDNTAKGVAVDESLIDRINAFSA